MDKQGSMTDSGGPPLVQSNITTSNQKSGHSSMRESELRQGPYQVPPYPISEGNENQSSQVPIQLNITDLPRTISYPVDGEEKQNIKVKKLVKRKVPKGDGKRRQIRVNKGSGQYSRDTSNGRHKQSAGHRHHSGHKPQTQRLKQILIQVSELQKQIQKLPQHKGKHYFDPYTKIGTNPAHLNLIDPEKSLKRKRHIQAQAQNLLIEIQNHREANLGDYQDGQGIEFIQSDYQPAIKMLDDTNHLAKDSIQESMRRPDMIRKDCSDCGMEQNITEQTSLEMIKQGYGFVGKSQSRDREPNQTSDSNTTMVAPDLPVNIDTMKKCCIAETKKIIPNTQSEKFLVCNGCGNAAIIALTNFRQNAPKPKGKNTLKGIKIQRGRISNFETTKGERLQGKESSSLKKGRGSADSIKKSKILKGRNSRSRSGNRIITKTGDYMLMQSQQLNANDLTETNAVSQNLANTPQHNSMINLQINTHKGDKEVPSGRYQSALVYRAANKTSAGSSKRSLKNSRSNSRSKSRSKSKSRPQSVSKPGARVQQQQQQVKAFMCSRCVRPKSYLCPKRDLHEKPEKLEPSRLCPIHGHINYEDIESDVTKRTRHRDDHPRDDYKTAEVNIFVTKTCAPSESANDTNGSVAVSKRIRDSVEYTSMTNSAKEPFNLVELDRFEQEELSDALISELKLIAEGHFELGDDKILLSPLASIEEDNNRKSQDSQINVLSLGAYTVAIPEKGDFAAQSNIATEEGQSIHQTSYMLHSEYGLKHAKGSDKAIDHERGSGVYGSEIEYTKAKTKQELGIEQDDDEEDDDEEEYEEEYEEEMEEEDFDAEEKDDKRSKAASMAKTGSAAGIEEEDSDSDESEQDQLSRKTSFSDFYVIDREEEHRLKQIAMERYLADKQLERKFIVLGQEPRETRPGPVSFQVGTKLASDEEKGSTQESAEKDSQHLKRPRNYVRRDASGRDLILSSEGECGESESNVMSLSKQNDDTHSEVKDYQEANQSQSVKDQSDHDVQGSQAEEGVDANTINSVGETVCTQKAFNNQKLYEEARVYRAGMSAVSATVFEDEGRENDASALAIGQEASDMKVDSGSEQHVDAGTTQEANNDSSKFKDAGKSELVNDKSGLSKPPLIYQTNSMTKIGSNLPVRQPGQNKGRIGSAKFKKQSNMQVKQKGVMHSHKNFTNLPNSNLQSSDPSNQDVEHFENGDATVNVGNLVERSDAGEMTRKQPLHQDDSQSIRLSYIRKYGFQNNDASIKDDISQDDTPKNITLLSETCPEKQLLLSQDDQMKQSKVPMKIDQHLSPKTAAELDSKSIQTKPLLESIYVQTSEPKYVDRSCQDSHSKNAQSRHMSNKATSPHLVNMPENLSQSNKHSSSAAESCEKQLPSQEKQDNSSQEKVFQPNDSFEQDYEHPQRGKTIDAPLHADQVLIPTKSAKTLGWKQSKDVKEVKGSRDEMLKSLEIDDMQRTIEGVQLPLQRVQVTEKASHNVSQRINSASDLTPDDIECQKTTTCQAAGKIITGQVSSYGADAFAKEMVKKHGIDPLELEQQESNKDPILCEIDPNTNIQEPATVPNYVVSNLQEERTTLSNEDSRKENMLEKPELILPEETQQPVKPILTNNSKLSSVRPNYNWMCERPEQEDNLASPSKCGISSTSIVSKNALSGENNLRKLGSLELNSSDDQQSQGSQNERDREAELLEQMLKKTTPNSQTRQTSPHLRKDKKKLQPLYQSLSPTNVNIQNLKAESPTAEVQAQTSNKNQSRRTNDVAFLKPSGTSAKPKSRRFNNAMYPNHAVTDTVAEKQTLKAISSRGKTLSNLPMSSRSKEYHTPYSAQLKMTSNQQKSRKQKLMYESSHLANARLSQTAAKKPHQYWDSQAEKNLHDILQKRALKRMQELNHEFSGSSHHLTAIDNQILQEKMYQEMLMQKRVLAHSQGVGDADQFNKSIGVSQRQKLPLLTNAQTAEQDAILMEKQKTDQVRPQSINMSSDALQGESTCTELAEPLSNFQAQYRTIKKRQIKAGQERRGISLSRPRKNKNSMPDNSYHSGEQQVMNKSSTLTTTIGIQSHGSTYATQKRVTSANMPQNHKHNMHVLGAKQSSQNQNANQEYDLDFDSPQNIYSQTNLLHVNQSLPAVDSLVDGGSMKLEELDTHMINFYNRANFAHMDSRAKIQASGPLGLGSSGQKSSVSGSMRKVFVNSNSKNVPQIKAILKNPKYQAALQQININKANQAFKAPTSHVRQATSLAPKTQPGFNRLGSANNKLGVNLFC